MVSAGIHAPEKIVQTISHPVQRHARAIKAGGKHPTKLLPSQSSIMGIVE
jgi:hypothetical protein